MSADSLIQFVEIWERIASNLSQRSLDNAMRDWCKELDIEKRLECPTDLFIGNIEQWLSNNRVVEASFKIYQILLRCTNDKLMKMASTVTQRLFLDNIGKEDFKENCRDSLKEMKSMNTKLVVLVAFVLVGVGISIYFSNQNKASSNRRAPISPARPVSSPPPKPEGKLLVLVVNAQSEKALQSLKESKRVTSDDCESLYSDTKWLWMGDTNEFEQSGLESRFNDRDVSEESESDVYLVQINLNESERGFEQNVVNRLPAFRRLPYIAGEVKVSARLPRKASQNPNLYC